MSDINSNESLLDIYVFETSQNLEQLELCILDAEESGVYTQGSINEIFRIMHTIKGSSAMMLYDTISALAHTIEDIFFFLREEKPANIVYSTLSDLILEAIDFIKTELQKIAGGSASDGNADVLREKINSFLLSIIDTKKDSSIKHYQAIISFEDGCEMENIRAYAIIHSLAEFADVVSFEPEDILENDGSAQAIRKSGFKVNVNTERSYGEVKEYFEQIIFLQKLELIQINSDDNNSEGQPEAEKSEKVRGGAAAFSGQNIISVNIAKLDKLMDLVGEMVIAEAMVTQNPDIKRLELDSFNKAARQLHKITAELQDVVMSIRMVTLSATFQRMNRVVRDMSKKLGKPVKLELIGEQTEVDKNIIEHVSDPIMHLVRNSIDHGIESAGEREIAGKPAEGKITLEAKNSGSDVLIIVKDDGKGLNKEKILKRARENNLLQKSEHEMSDREIYNLIFLPGFSTKDSISEYSGRGVGLDIVAKNIETIGGSVFVDSIDGAGLTVTLKLPLTLAIVDCMNIRIGNSCYTIPITAIKASFRPKEQEIIKDPDGNEMIMVRGQCYPIIRLHEFFNIKTDKTEFTDGILIMVEQDEMTLCLFADELIGQQQVVIKPIPDYIKLKYKINGITGCTLLGDGRISLILDVAGLADHY